MAFTRATPTTSGIVAAPAPTRVTGWVSTAVKSIGWPARKEPPIGAITWSTIGASSTSVTVIVKGCSVERPPESVERTRTEEDDRRSKFGCTATRSSLPSIVKDQLPSSPAPETIA